MDIEQGEEGAWTRSRGRRGHGHRAGQESVDTEHREEESMDMEQEEESVDTEQELESVDMEQGEEESMDTEQGRRAWTRSGVGE